MSFKRIAVFAGLAAAMLGASPALSASKLTFGIGLPATHAWVTAFGQPWLDDIKKGTNGEVTSEVLAGGSVVTFGTSLESLSKRVVDATLLTTQFFRKELPVNVLLVDVGGTFDNRMAAIAAATEMVFHECPECGAENKKWNILPLTPDSTAPYVLLCTTPIKSAEDMKGKRVRAIGLAGRVVEALGGIPANIVFAEIYESLQRRVIDCTFGEPVWLEAFSYKDMVTYVVDLAGTMNVIPHGIALNADFWKGLNDKQKALAVDAAATRYLDYVYTEQKKFADAKPELSKKITFAPAPDWARPLAAKARDQIRQEAVKTAKDAGVANADKIAERYVALYEKWAGKLKADTPREEMNRVLAELYGKYRP